MLPLVSPLFSSEVFLNKKYYTNELTAVPLRVLARGLGRQLPMPMAWLFASYFRLRGKLGFYFSPTFGVATLEDGRTIGQDQVPEMALRKWGPYLEQLRDLGFEIIAFRQPEVIGAKQSCVCLMWHPVTSVLTTLDWTRMPDATGVAEVACVEMNSYTTQDPEFMSVMVRREDMIYAEMFSIDFLDAYYMSNDFPVKLLLEKHLERIRGKPLMQISSDAAISVHKARNQRRFDWCVKAGLERPLSAKEVARVQQIRFE